MVCPMYFNECTDIDCTDGMSREKCILQEISDGIAKVEIQNAGLDSIVEFVTIENDEPKMDHSEIGPVESAGENNFITSEPQPVEVEETPRLQVPNNLLNS